MIVVFEIYEIKDLLFWPQKNPLLCTISLNYGMIRLRSIRATFPLLKLITNYWKVKGFFFKLLTHFEVKGPTPFDWYQKKAIVISNLFCSTSVQEFFITSEIWKKVFFRGRPHNSLMGPFSEIMESAYYLEQQPLQLLFNNVFQNISCFQAMSVQI